MFHTKSRLCHTSAFLRLSLLSVIVSYFPTEGVLLQSSTNKSLTEVDVVHKPMFFRDYFVKQTENKFLFCII